MEKALVSIIVPVYNVKEYLTRCVNSLRRQSYHNIEIVLVDDGSTDGSDKLCDSMAQEDLRIRVVHKENGGLSSARNAGIDVATGNYFVFVDSDDWISIKMIEKLIGAVLKHETKIAVCEYFSVFDDDLQISDISNKPERVLPREEAVESLIKGDIKDYAWNKIYARDLFDEIRFPVGQNYEDMATIYKTFLKAKSVVCIPDELYYYAIRAGSISNVKSKKGIIRNKNDALLAYYERIDVIAKAMPQLRDLVVQKFVTRAIAFLCYLDCECKNEDIAEYRRNTLTCLRRAVQLKTNLNKKLFIKAKLLLLTNDNFFILYEKGKKHIKYNLKRLPKQWRRFANKKLQELKDKKNVAIHLQSRDGRCAVLIGTPEHDNLGDHAIALATSKLLSSIYGNNIIEISEKEFLKFYRQIKRKLKNVDVVVLQGGGNWGNTYRYIDRLHSIALKCFKNQPIVVMPQTVYFSDDAEGRKCIQKYKQLFEKCENIVFFCREKASMELFKHYFPNIQCYFSPDVVLSLGSVITDYQGDRDRVLICLRNDKEGSLSRDDKLMILQELERRNISVLATDTCSGIGISKNQREHELSNKWRQFKDSSFIITDRLHGMIFSIITGTPCIVLGNYNHKVKSSYDFLSQKVSSLCYVGNSCELPQAIDKMIACNSVMKRKSFDSEFEGLKRVLLQKREA